MKWTASALLLWCRSFVVAEGWRTEDDIFDPLLYVDQLIGTIRGGNVFPGATIPYGMAKAVADSDSGDNQGGFVPDNSNITGFSSMHDSGTGGSPSLGNFPLFPYIECPGDDLDRCVYPKKTRKIHFIKDSIVTSPGYFGLTLVNKIKADMTAAHHTSLFRFKFPTNQSSTASTTRTTSSPVIILDLSDLSDSRQDNGTITVDSDTGRMTGGARFSPSFGTGSYNAYFCADFQGAKIRDSGIFVNSRASAAVKTVTVSRSINGFPLPAGGFVRFQSPGEILVRVAVSMISSQQACDSAQKEIPSFDFDATKTASEGMWREKLSPIRVSLNKVNISSVKNLYSSMYRTMISPQDYTGENPLWTSDEPYFDSFYCLWDSFRSQIPFLIILDPKQMARIIRSLIDTYVHDGWLPDCRMSLCRGYTQGGSNADVVLADAFIKGITDGIDWNKGYAAVVKDAEEEPFDWCCHGRGGLDSWKSLGYIPVQDFDHKGFGTMTRSISRTLEYSYNDFCVSQIAAGLGGREAEVEKYVQRSSGWENLFKADIKSFVNGANSGFTGFFQPRYLNRTWGYQDPLKCSQIDPSNNSVCSLQNTAAETFESSIWEYGFFVPHDLGSLISSYGGPETFVRRLDFLHDNKIGDFGNEPAFITVFEYHYAGRPGLSAKRARSVIKSKFRATRDGLPGNDDSGAMGSFVAFCMMGLFPNPGQNVYLISPPFFESINVTSPLTGRTARVSVTNFDPSDQSPYIQNVTLNGKPYTRSWITHDFFTQGWELDITIGKNESSWGTHIDDLPPSMGPYTTYNESSRVSRLYRGNRLLNHLKYEREGEGFAKQYWGSLGMM